MPNFGNVINKIHKPSIAPKGILIFSIISNIFFGLFYALAAGGSIAVSAPFWVPITFAILGFLLAAIVIASAIKISKGKELDGSLSYVGLFSGIGNLMFLPIVALFLPWAKSPRQTKREINEYKLAKKITDSLTQDQLKTLTDEVNKQASGTTKITARQFIRLALTQFPEIAKSYMNDRLSSEVIRKIQQETEDFIKIEPKKDEKGGKEEKIEKPEDKHKLTIDTLDPQKKPKRKKRKNKKISPKKEEEKRPLITQNQEAGNNL